MYESRHTYRVLTRIEEQLQGIQVTATTGPYSFHSGPSSVTTGNVPTAASHPFPDEESFGSAGGALLDGDQSVLHFDNFRVSLMHDKVTNSRRFTVYVLTCALKISSLIDEVEVLQTKVSSKVFSCVGVLTWH